MWPFKKHNYKDHNIGDKQKKAEWETCSTFYVKCICAKAHFEMIPPDVVLI